MRSFSATSFPPAQPRLAPSRALLASVLLSWLPQPRFCPMGSFAALTRISPGPPKNALQLTAIARRKLLRSPFCAPREQGAEKENHTMYQNRATLIGTLGKAADNG